MQSRVIQVDEDHDNMEIIKFLIERGWAVSSYDPREVRMVRVKDPEIEPGPFVNEWSL